MSEVHLFHRPGQRAGRPALPFLGHIYYGWVIAAAAFAITLTLGEAMWSFGVFLKPLQEEFGWSRALTSSANTALLLAYAPSAFLMGRLADRYGPRPILLLGGVLTGLGFILASRAHTINELRLYNALAGFGAGATWSVPLSVVQRWFIKSRGTVLGLVVVGVGVGGTVFPPLTNYLIHSYGWRGAYVVLGIIYLVIIVAASSVMVHSPERKGLKPYGAEAFQNQEASKVWRAGEWTTRQALSNRSFYLLAAMYMLSVAPTQIVLTHLVPFSVDMGLSDTAGAVALGLIGLLSIPGRILMGIMADRIGWLIGLSLTNLGAVVAIGTLILVREPWALYAFALLYGLCHGARVPTMTGSVSFFFGTIALGALIGIIHGIGSIGSAFAPYLGGFIFDTTGSYILAFSIVGVSWLTAGIMALRAGPPKGGPRNSQPPSPSDVSAK